MSVGLGLLFSIVAVVASVATGVFGYSYALEHARAVQVNGGIAFGVAMLAAGLAIVAIHAFDD
ncbi:hypothetical protein GBQ70_14835 [Halomicrobium sp. ZPS1]|uniref:Uncharacterized protein n=3 Tax=Haloarculaceae TaxID=1963268 RepID=C7NXL6_HALMD|nr:conserved hypothetical protein [Halomicrobium mukohataei DSM 12286]MBO4248338.1 hypothetical protein [Halomicrobium sp. IBSBa]NLV10636.1 hypothetical protein [Halomicrobium mukohataei]QCD67134.1 hypothetical protein E5139_14820 [Halomicrobium mukohataei]QFR21941.1 hypothetical protein GBQ70_14835 [Halomicrobium sp. ZPS1]